MEYETIKLILMLIGAFISGGCFVAFWIDRELKTIAREPKAVFNKDLSKLSDDLSNLPGLSQRQAD